MNEHIFLYPNRSERKVIMKTSFFLLCLLAVHAVTSAFMPKYIHPTSCLKFKDEIQRINNVQRKGGILTRKERKIWDYWREKLTYEEKKFFTRCNNKKLIYMYWNILGLLVV